MKKTVLFLLSLAAGFLVRAELSPEIMWNEEKLIEMIGKPGTSDNDRVTACQNLGWCGGAKASAALAGLLEDVDASEGWVGQVGHRFSLFLTLVLRFSIY